MVYQLGNTSSHTITEVKHRRVCLVLGCRLQELSEYYLLILSWLDFSSCLCVDTELAIGQYSLRVHGTCGLNNS